MRWKGIAERAARQLLSPWQGETEVASRCADLGERNRILLQQINELEMVKREHLSQICLLEEQLAGATELAKQQAVEHQERLSVLQEERDRQARLAMENFEVVCSIAKQRDEWQQIYQLQSTENLTAQRMLGVTIIKTREMAVRIMVAFNKLREEHGLKPIKIPEDMPDAEAPPVSLVEQFGRRIKELHDQMPRPLQPSAAHQPGALSPSE
jgi:hypothetical protein